MNTVDQVKLSLTKIITNKINEQGLTQKQAAAIGGLTQPRISYVKANKIDIFTIDKLLDVAEKLGTKIYWDWTAKGISGLVLE